MENLCHTQQRARSSNKPNFLRICQLLFFSYTIIHSGWYRLSGEVDDFIIHYLLHTQHSAVCSLMQSVNPMFVNSRKENSLGSACNSGYKALPFPIPFSPKSLGLDISYGRFPERWAVAGHRWVCRSIFHNSSFSLKAFWILLLHVTNLWQDSVWNGGGKNDQFSRRRAWADPTSALNDPVSLSCV